VRDLVDDGRVRGFMRAFGRAAPAEGTCFLTGGATAVLIGWRSSTIDVDIALAPEQDELLRALPALKEQLRINVELASPAQFIPLPAGWEERSPFVAQEGKLTFRHFDLYSQALAKLERAHRRDADDVRAMVDAGLVDPARLRAAYDEIESSLYRFPAVDARAFRARVEEVAAAI
jgi:hypothetical protein